MESLKIRTGEVRIRILDDRDEERGIFKFNPEDIETTKKFFNVQKDFEVKQKEFLDKSELCTTPDKKIELLSEIVDYLKTTIDDCFGQGSSQILFGDNCSLTMFEDFFEGITPYYEQASKARIEKYKNKLK